MKVRCFTIVSCVLSLISFASVSAQQPQPAKPKPPRLTTDDLTTPATPSAPSPEVFSRPSQPAASRPPRPVLKKRFPRDFGLSIDLPDEPEFLRQSQFGATGQENAAPVSYQYQDNDLSVYLVRYTAGKQTVLADELKQIASEFMEQTMKQVRSVDDGELVRIKDATTVLMRGSYVNGGTLVSIRGIARTKGKYVWVIVARFLPDDQQTGALALQVLGSVRLQ